MGSIRTLGPQAGRVYAKLYEWILLGKLAPGEKIFAQRVADEIGTSRAPVQDALRRLAGEGLLDPGNSGRCSVVSFSPSYCRGISMVREALEKESTRLCTERATERDIERLRVLCRRTVSATWTSGAVEDLDLELDFHRAIAQVSGYVQLRDEIERFVTPMLTAFLRFRIPRRPAYKPRSDGGHDLVVDAIESGDPDRAEQVIGAHVRASMEVLVRYAQAGNGAGQEPLSQRPRDVTESCVLGKSGASP